ncbi:Na(+)-translocating NADH-quinone reductase subunit C [Desulfosediminicola sp.]|uniref:Na(+)-translocating NADH-quinone reductase subunit C n=1 Tax=Desulfosediminicola sp. TaxID=2886825 RepID=UPI003AF2390F
MVDIRAAKPFYSVLILAFACSALVAGAAVGLRPRQEANRQLDRQKNILYAAGLFEEGKSIDQLFANVETRLVDLESGEFVEADQLDPKNYNQRRAALSNDLGRPIEPDADLAKLGRQEKISLVYVIKDNDTISQIVLPVRGKGLWSTMYAYVAIDSDLNTIRGVSFYEHGETPGLGGEVSNPRWQQRWGGKKVYKDEDVAIRVIKGTIDETSADAAYEIDGLSGATLTSNGVSDLLKFWFGDHGFQPFLSQLKKKDNSNG